MKKYLLTISMLLIMVVAFAQNQISELSRGMVAHFPLSEWYPNIDLVSGKVGTSTATYPIAGRNGDGANRYYSFNGSSDYVTLPTIPAFGTSDFSVIINCKINSISALNGFIGGGTNAFTLYSKTNGTLWVEKNSAADPSNGSTGIVSITSTVMVGYSRTGTTGTYWINGSAVGTCTDNLNYTSASTILGGYNSSTYLLNGSISLVRIFNYALTPTQIANYSKPEYPIEWVDRGATTNLITNGTFTGSTTDWVIEASGWAYNSNNIISTASNGYIYHMTVGSGTDRQILVSITASNVQGSPYVKLGGVGNYDTVHGFTIVNGTQTKSIHSYTDFPNYLFIHNANGGAGTIIDDVSAYYQGCVLDLNSSGLSRRTTNAYNTGYWSDLGNSIEATVSGAAPIIPPASNLTATWFDANSSKLQWTGMDGLTGNITLFGKIFVNSFGEGNAGRIFDNSKVVLYTNSIGYLTFSRDGSTTVNSAAASQAINTYYNFAVTSTSTGVTNIYINGVLSGTANQSAGTPASGTTWNIGNNAAGSATFGGHIREVGIINRVLEPDAIKLLNETY